MSLVGKLAKQLEYGVDAKSWSSTSESDWVFTISAGAGQRPIEGRGILQSREESGSTVRARAWLGQAFEIGGGYDLDSRTVDITAPGLDDPTSFNYFRNFLYSKPGTDSLVLPDSIVTNKAKRDGWSAGGGVAVHLPFPPQPARGRVPPAPGEAGPDRERRGTETEELGRPRRLRDAGHGGADGAGGISLPLVG